MFRTSLCLTLLLSLPANAQTGTPGIPAFDQFMANTMSKYGVPGGSLAITRNGKLIMARGYGVIDQANNVPAQPDTLYRIASLSKTITAVTVMHLVETGKLSMDQPAFALLPDLQSPTGTDLDPRLATITIRQLLTHTAGWDPDKSGDPTDRQAAIAGTMGVPSPVSSDNMVRYMRGQMLDNDPGLYYAYSNFGYDVLGRIVDRVTGMSYEQYVRTNVLAPMGITTARIAQTLPQGRLPGESLYFADQKAESIFPNVTPKFVSVAYGAWYMEGFDADGGWVISAIDYAKLINAIDGQKGAAFLKPATVAAMTARPGARNWDGQDNWYACGLAVKPTAKGQQWWNAGAIDGTFTYFFRNDDGTVMVVFYNSRSNPPGRESGLENDTIAGLNSAAAQVTNWPTNDYIGSYPDADPVKAAAKPAITTAEGVRNGATFDRGIVSGSWATLYGVNLSKTTRSWTGADITGNQLPTSLDGVSVKVNGQPAAVSYVSPTQINVQVPAGIAPGWVTVEAINNGTSTGSVLALVEQNAPGLFTAVKNGVTMAVATKDDAVLDDRNIAKPGDIISLYATGIAPSPAGTLIAKPQEFGNPEVVIGGIFASVKYTGVIAPGLFQLNVVVPAVDAGNQEVIITPNKVSSPRSVFLPIAQQ